MSSEKQDEASKGDAAASKQTTESSKAENGGGGAALAKDDDEVPLTFPQRVSNSAYRSAFVFVRRAFTNQMRH